MGLNWGERKKKYRYLTWNVNQTQHKCHWHVYVWRLRSVSAQEYMLKKTISEWSGQGFSNWGTAMPQPAMPCCVAFKGWGWLNCSNAIPRTALAGGCSDLTWGLVSSPRHVGLLWSPLHCSPCLRTLKKNSYMGCYTIFSVSRGMWEHCRGFRRLPASLGGLAWPQVRSEQAPSFPLPARSWESRRSSSVTPRTPTSTFNCSNSTREFEKRWYRGILGREE